MCKIIKYLMSAELMKYSIHPGPSRSSSLGTEVNPIADMNYAQSTLLRPIRIAEGKNIWRKFY